MKFSKIAWKNIGMSAAALSLFVACDPVPRRELTPEEKQADMMWLYSKFGANYAPLEYKQELWNFDYETLKSTYLEAAAETPDNEAFYALVQQFVAEFKDAHTSVAFTASGRPGRETVAYLGFSGRREGNNFVVTELFPTIKKDATLFPIVPGTVITKVNGLTLKEYINANLTKTSNLGQDDANLTYLMNRIFTRLDIQTPLPKEQDVTLTLLNAETGKGEDVVLPWVKKDLYSFRKDATEAASEAPKKEKEEPKETVTMINVNDSTQIPFSFMNFDGSAFNLNSFSKKSKLPSFLERISSTQFKNGIAGWTTQVEKLKSVGPKDKLTKLRVIPEGAMMVEESTIYPAYIFPSEIDGKIVTMGYILVDTFSPDGNPMPGVKATLAKMQKLGIKDLVIDTVNNGGGSLVLLMELAQALSNKPVIMPGMQIGLNEGWIDSIEDAVSGSGSDAEKVLYQRLLSDLLAYKSQGLRISPKESAYPISVLTPFFIKPHKELKSDFNVVLLVNEMCASACDIFAGIVQDNKMGTLIGSRTMGAGGNVVNYWQAPNTNMDIRQTESLLVRTNGQYIENVGVTPEVSMVVSESASALYEPIRLKAVEILSSKYKTPTPAPSVR